MRPLLAVLFALVLAAPARAAGPELGIARHRERHQRHVEAGVEFGAVG